MENLIILICLDYQFACKVAQDICCLTGKFYLDSEQLLEYEIPNKEEIISSCGYEYLKKQEKKFINGLADYENTVVTVKYEMFCVDENYKIFKNLPCYYLRLSQQNTPENVVEKISYKDRCNLLEQYCKNHVDCNGESTDVAKQIVLSMSKR